MLGSNDMASDMFGGLRHILFFIDGSKMYGIGADVFPNTNWIPQAISSRNVVDIRDLSMAEA